MTLINVISHNTNEGGEHVFDWTSGFTNENNRVIDVCVGDTIKFEWGSGHDDHGHDHDHDHDEGHNVLLMPDENAFSGCDFSSATLLGSESPVTTEAFTTTGVYYYSCSVTGHCGQGQKLAVTVNNGTCDDDSGAAGELFVPLAILVS